MAAELSLLSMTQLQNLAQQQQQQQQNPSMWTWIGRRPPVADESWEVRAFAEDTGSIMGTTWPPRSYTCTFCRREFRSAQALGGHMNVHRRDRARLRQSPPVSDPSSSTTTPPLIFPPPEFVAGGGLCLLYSIPSSAGAVFTPTMDSPYPGNGLVSPCPPTNNLPNASYVDATQYHMGKVGSIGRKDCDDGDDETVVEELDLELRLGW